LSSLSLAEFAYNNNVHSSIGHSPFVANYGFDPRTPYNLIDPPIELILQPNNDTKSLRKYLLKPLNSTPSNMKVHPVFHISLLKEFNSLFPETEVLDNIPSSNDMIYGDDTLFVHSIIDHKRAPHPSTYAKGPALLFKVK
jgi:hypothetical protein